MYHGFWTVRPKEMDSNSQSADQAGSGGIARIPPLPEKTKQFGLPVGVGDRLVVTGNTQFFQGRRRFAQIGWSAHKVIPFFQYRPGAKRGVSWLQVERKHRKVFLGRRP